jgi:hypothetical protein
VKWASSSTTLAFLMLLLFGSFASAGTDQPVAVVSTLSGDVSVVRAGGSIPLRFKAEAFPGDIIRTADQSVVRLLLRQKALMTVQQRSVLTLREEHGTPTVVLETGQIGVSVADRRLLAGDVLQIETPNVQAALGPGNVIVNTSKVSGRVQTTVYVVDGSVEISVPGTAARRSVKVEAPRKLTVVGKALGNARTLSSAESTQLLAQLRTASPQHLNAPPEIERVIVQHGRTEAAKQEKLVAKQVKQAGGSGQGSESSRSRSETGTDLTAEKGTGLESGPKVGLDSTGRDVGSGGVSTVDNKVAVSTGSGGHSIIGAAPAGLGQTGIQKPPLTAPMSTSQKVPTQLLQVAPKPAK